MKKVTGIGGIFFKTKDTEATKAWYSEHLGLTETPGMGVVFAWRPFDNPSSAACSIWSPFKETTNHFSPSEHDYMINYRVADLEGLLAELKAAGVTVVGDMQVYDFGKFGWVLDPDGRKIELWEPLGPQTGESFKDGSIY
ncbi:VOC family protein [Flaviaesturariibacter flavus]|uniref:VOC family protein n=1 Tax=Flaviaesturariibacter flavus TaxID=2502780 RepID=A0A4R1BB25_9BACT|nr:VOC family protein [Flaviaesturariibacter flavus]TCJ14128.1 VOC family protein [Flaviaesturariibacter flavus]